MKKLLLPLALAAGLCSTPVTYTNAAVWNSIGNTVVQGYHKTATGLGYCRDTVSDGYTYCKDTYTANKDTLITLLKGAALVGTFAACGHYLTTDPEAQVFLAKSLQAKYDAIATYAAKKIAPKFLEVVLFALTVDMVKAHFLPSNK